MKAISSPELSLFPSKGSRPLETRVIADHVESFRPIKRKNTLHRIMVEEEGLMALKSTSPFVDSLVQNVSKEVEQQNEAGKRAQDRLIL